MAQSTLDALLPIGTQGSVAMRGDSERTSHPPAHESMDRPSREEKLGGIVPVALRRNRRPLSRLRCAGIRSAAIQLSAPFGPASRMGLSRESRFIGLVRAFPQPPLAKR